MENNNKLLKQLITMNKIQLQQNAEVVQATAHLLIATLALLTSKQEFRPIYQDHNTGEQSIGDPIISVSISQWLRQLKFFTINEFDKTRHYNFQLETAAKILESESSEQAIQHLFGISITYPIVRIFELLKTYFSEKGNLSDFRSQPWYKVAYILRNCFSHDFILQIKGRNKEHTEKRINELLPAKWDNIIITKDMLGKPLSRKDVNIGDHIKLIDAMCNYGKSL